MMKTERLLIEVLESTCIREILQSCTMGEAAFRERLRRTYCHALLIRPEVLNEEYLLLPDGNTGFQAVSEDCSYDPRNMPWKELLACVVTDADTDDGDAAFIGQFLAFMTARPTG